MARSLVSARRLLQQNTKNSHGPLDIWTQQHQFKCQFQTWSKNGHGRLEIWTKHPKTKNGRLVSKRFNSGQPASLTPQEASDLLRRNEFSMGGVMTDSVAFSGGTKDSLAGAVRSYDSNTLASNSPSEDAHGEVLLKAFEDGRSIRESSGDDVYSGSLFGIFDGHGGPACGQVVAKRMFHYVAAALLSLPDLKAHLAAVTKGDSANTTHNLIKVLNADYELVPELRDYYHQSYLAYLTKLITTAESDPDTYSEKSVSDRLNSAFLALDSDLSEEAVNAGETTTRDVALRCLTVAMSGCVGAVAHVSGADLHIASTGDCVAVLGSLSDNNTWVARKLTVDHNTDNQKELDRIESEHPGESMRDIIKGDRLLGSLAPLRAFGDFKFKWPADTIRELFSEYLGDRAVLDHYKTPPYLTAEPEISYHRLTPRDRFLVIGSDGLWDMMTPMQVIRLVGEHMQGRITLNPLHISSDHAVNLKDVNQLLRRRQAALKLRPTDANAATHLIRSALGGSAYGVDHARLSNMLTLPKDMVRMFRDDMTVTVLFFDDDYIRTL